METLQYEEHHIKRHNMNYTKITLGELLSHANETIKRNAMSILKTLQKEKACERHGLTSVGNCMQCNERLGIGHKAY